MVFLKAPMSLLSFSKVTNCIGWGIRNHREVTDDHRYKNNNLAVHPFLEWMEETV